MRCSPPLLAPCASWSWVYNVHLGCALFCLAPCWSQARIGTWLLPSICAGALGGLQPLFAAVTCLTGTGGVDLELEFDGEAGFEFEPCCLLLPEQTDQVSLRLSLSLSTLPAAPSTG